MLITNKEKNSIMDIDIISKYIKSTIFSDCEPKDLARIVPHVEKIECKKDDVLFETGDGAEYFYIFVSGKIELKSGKRSLAILEEGTVGEESIFDDGKYLATAKVLENSSFIRFPRKQLMDLLKKYPNLKDESSTSLINHHSFVKLNKTKKIKKIEKEEDATIVKIIGWGLTIIVPIIIYFFGDTWGLNWKSKVFLTVAAATIIMWVFRLANEFIPSIFAILVILILDIAPPEVALSGFTSGSFFMAMSIFGISALLVSSGLTYRLVIYLFKVLPLSQFWHSLAIFFTGIVMTPLLPSANGRISLATPILIDMAESLGYKANGKASTRLAIATFSGFTMFSTIFLSSKAIHFVIFGLLPTQISDQFTWGFWFYASIIAGIVLLVFYILLTQIMLKNTEKPKLSKEIIDIQYKILGPLTREEWAALGGILLFAVGIASSTVHKIQLPWIGLTVLYVILAFGYMSKKEFRINIDWTFLVYLGTLIGIVKSMSFIGLDIALGKNLAWLGAYSTSNFPLFVLLLSGAILLMRLFIPNNATVAILASVLFPIAALSGVNPWIVGFIILIMSDAWILPYQSTYYVLFEEMIAKKKLFNINLLLKFNFITIVFRLVAIYASIPFWRFIGIL